MTNPTDEELMELMPQLAARRPSRCGPSPGRLRPRRTSKPTGAMRIILNRHAVDHARAVLAKWGHQ
jgi:hypothetical protein